MSRGPASRCRPGPVAGASRFVGDPVDVVTGTVVDEETDFRLPEASVFFAWSRTYDSSRRQNDRGLGRGFRHSLDHELRFDVDGMCYVDPEWNEVAFPALDVDGGTSLRQTLILERVSEERYRVEYPSGRTYEFVFVSPSEPARLLHIREGEHSIELQYEPHRAQLNQVLLGSLGSLRVDWSEGRIARISLAKAGSPTRSDLVRYSYDAEARLVEVENAYKHRLKHVYDGAHRVVQKVDRRGYAFHFEYDAQDRCIASRGDDGAESVRIEYRPLERTTIVTRHDGGAWQYLYNASGTITHVIDPYQGTQVFVLDDEGRVIEEIDPHGNVSQIIYDARGVPVERVDPLGHRIQLPEDIEAAHPLDHWQGESPLEWEYGTLIEVGPAASTEPSSAATFKLPGRVRAAIRPATPATREVANVQGLPLREERAGGASRRFGFDENANLRLEVDFEGHERRYEYKSDNHLAREIDALDRVVRYEHSATEELVGVTDAGGQRSAYKLDLKDRVVEVQRNGRVRERYEYDIADNHVATRNGRGDLLVSMTIGPGNLEVARTLASGESQRFEYDDAGRVSRAEGPVGSCSFAHDAFGRRLLDQRDGLGVEHVYEAGRHARTRVLGRFVVRHQRLDDDTHWIVDPTGAAHRIDSLGAGLLARHLHNGWSELAQFDRDGRCLGKYLYRLDDADRRWQRSFEYSPEGDLLTREDNVQGTQRFAYDAAHRLEQVTRPDGAVDRYRYDAADNLLFMPGLREGFVTDPTLAASAHAGDGENVALQSGNRLHRANGELFLYDERDHIATREHRGKVTNYLRDSLDQLVRIDGPELAWSAKYDALGRRAEKTVDGQQWTYYWDTDRLAAEVFPDGALRVYVYADPRAVVPMLFVDYASIDADPRSGKRYSVVTNHLGAVELIHDEDGITVWRAQYQPYGAVHIEEGADFHQPLRFPGHFYDAETGLHYNRFRYYDPRLGRYLESDPIGIEGGLNLYAYTNNPLREVDLRGLKSKCPNGKNCPIRKKKEAEKKAAKESAKTKAAARATAHKALAEKPQKELGGRRAIFPSLKRKGWDPETRTLQFDKRTKAGRHAPDGVKYDARGNPKFPDSALHKDTADGPIPIDDFTDNRKRNMRQADAEMRDKYGKDWKRPKGYTWHEDRQGQMQLVQTDVHGKTPHTGGVSKAKNSP